MTTAMTRTELQAWIDAYATPDAPDAQTLADFLGIELAEPEPPVGQRRRSPDGVEVVKTDDGTPNPWQRYRGIPGPTRFTDGEVADWEAITGPTWFTDDEVADWQIVTDAPEVPEDVLNAAAQLIAADVCPCDGECDSGCIGTGDRLARILADAGLLVGTKCDREHLDYNDIEETA